MKFEKISKYGAKVVAIISSCRDLTIITKTTQCTHQNMSSGNRRHENCELH